MLRHIHINCAREGCYAVITVHPDEERRLRRTRESFYCPAGHSNYFPGKTEEEKRVEQLERLLDSMSERQGQAYEVVDALKRGALVCPMGCGFHTRRTMHGWPPAEGDVARFLDRVWTDLRQHLVAAHNATLAPVALLEAGEAT